MIRIGFGAIFYYIAMIRNPPNLLWGSTYLSSRLLTIYYMIY